MGSVLTPGEAFRALRAQRRSSLATLLALVLVAGISVASVAHRFPELSVYDEAAHLDYVYRVAHGEVPRMGERLSDEVVAELLCGDEPASERDDCEAGAQADALGAEGFQYEAQQPPVYYAATALLRPLVALGPSDDLLLTTRLVGAAWLFAGLLAFWLALARLRVRPIAAATILAVAAVSPAVIYHSATVTNDAAVLLLGAVTVHLLLASTRPATVVRLLAWSGLAWLAVWTKPQIVLAFAAMGLTAAWRRERPGWRPVHDDLWLVPVAVSGLSYLVWSALVDARAIIDPDIVLDALLGFKQTDQFSVSAALGQLRGLVSALVGPTPLLTRAVAGIGTLLLYVIIAGDLRAVLEKGRASLSALAGWISLVATVLAGPAFTVLFYVQWRLADGPSPRYGLVLLPGMLLGLVDVTEHRRARILVQGLVLALAAAIVAVVIDPSMDAP